MNKYLIVFITCVLNCLFSNSYAQKSVDDCTLAAKRVQRRMDARSFNKFQVSYEKAIVDIESIKLKADTAKFGYDDVADHADSWIKLYQTLGHFKNGKVSFNGKTIDIKMVDYTPVLEDAKAKASKEHFDAAMNIIQSTIIFENRLKAFPHLDKTKKYSDAYNDKISNCKAKVYYDEGLRLYNEDKEFKEREKILSFFDKALEQVSPYKDARELSAKLYAEKADLLSKSNNLQDLRKAITLYDKSMEYIPGYNDGNGKKMLVKQKGASILYSQADTRAKENSFDSQNEAANIFKRAGEWITGYKDIDKRVKESEKLSSLNVLIQDSDGKIMIPNASINGLTSMVKKYILFPKVDDVSIDMRQTVNYSKVAKELGSGFVLLKMNVGKVNYTYKGVKVDTTKEEIKKFYLIKRSLKTGKNTEKEIAEKAYKEGQKELKSSRSHTDGNFRISYKQYKGVLSTIASTATVVATYPIEIWDVRDPLHPAKIKEIVESQTTSDTKKRTIYSGSYQIKPELIKGDRVMDKDDLMAKAKEKKPSVSAILNDMKKEFSAVLNKIKFVRY